MRRKLVALAALPIIAISLTACTDKKDDAGTITPAPEVAQSEPAEEEKPAEEPAEEETPAATNPTFGETYTWDDGLAITISAVEPYEPSEHAAGLEEGQTPVRFTVTVTNGTTEDIEAMMFGITVSSAGKEASQVIDLDWSTPTSTILPGNSLEWVETFGVADPANMQVTANYAIDFNRDKVHFTN